MEYKKPHLTHPYVPHPNHKRCSICDHPRELHKSEFAPKPKDSQEATT